PHTQRLEDVGIRSRRVHALSPARRPRESRLPAMSSQAAERHEALDGLRDLPRRGRHSRGPPRAAVPELPYDDDVQAAADELGRAAKVDPETPPSTIKAFALAPRRAIPGRWAEVPGRWAEVPGWWAQVPGRSAQVPDRAAQVPGRLAQVPGWWAQ